MEMWSLVAFGALLGMQHALEADHLAAVAALSARRSSRFGIVLRGAYWGFGHTVALFAICGAVILLGVGLDGRVEAMIELGVGAMVACLGGNVLRTLVRRRIHFHLHEHGSGVVHIHAHSHADDTRPHPDDTHHRHKHPERGLLKALAIGLAHGAAGSGALLVLVVAAAESATLALAYVACFGLGSIIGMAALSFVASFPLKAAERSAAGLNTATVAAIGIFAILIGGNTILESWPLIGF